MKTSRKIEGVVEAVRIAPDGNMALARVYERRGSSFSDHVLLTRGQFLERLKAGKVYVTGKRKELLGFTFDTGAEFDLTTESGLDVLRLKAANAERPSTGGSQVDDLKGVPVF